MPGMLLMPGFIDAHHHLTQTFGKALAFGEPSEIFRRIWVPMEGVLDEEMVYLSSKAGALESLRGGFTTVVDAGTRAAGDASAVARATQEAGLRCVLGFICNDLGRDGSEILQIRRVIIWTAGPTTSWCIPRWRCRSPKSLPTPCSCRSRRCARRPARYSRPMSTNIWSRSRDRWSTAACGRSSICIISGHWGRRCCWRMRR